MAEAKQVFNPPTPAAVAEARALLRGADHAALATIEPGSGDPVATRVGLADFPDGTPLIVASALTAHFEALRNDGRCSLLVGSVGKGDPLAHPRLMLKCRAEIIAPGSDRAAEARSRYLGRHPRAAIYVDLPDFRLFRLDIVAVRFNAGFGRAFLLAPETLID